MRDFTTLSCKPLYTAPGASVVIRLDNDTLLSALHLAILEPAAALAVLLGKINALAGKMDPDSVALRQGLAGTLQAQNRIIQTKHIQVFVKEFLGLTFDGMPVNVDTFILQAPNEQFLEVVSHVERMLADARANTARQTASTLSTPLVN